MSRRRKSYLKYLDKDAISRITSEPLLTPFPMEGSVSGHHRSPHKGSSVEFAEYREYVTGEDPRRMDWRVYARSDRYYLKEFEAETNLRCYLALDCSGSMGFGATESKLEYAKKLAATFAYLIIGQGDAAGLLAIRDKKFFELPAKRNPAQIQEMLETIGPLKPKGSPSLVDGLHNLAERVRPRGMTVVISDFLDEPKDLIDAIHHLRDRRHDVVLFHIIDPQEEDFPFERPTRFVDLEGAGSLITEPAVIREQYLESMRIHLESLSQGCLESEADHRIIRTDVPVAEVLDKFLGERSAGKAA
ncbi:MAG: DUF58 domain-containing protein [Opitutae bacterium]|nr:DUF58 domain-containing protein [Opitutae bacterium]